jgi:hypothetical protein
MKNKRIYVIVTLQVEGIHRWKNALEKEPQVSFLAHPHRHIFHIAAAALVSHGDREVEIIKLKRAIEEYLKINYFSSSLNLHHFGDMSCEMIANDLLEAFNLDNCKVLEDNENGAMVCK